MQKIELIEYTTSFLLISQDNERDFITRKVFVLYVIVLKNKKKKI